MLLLPVSEDNLSLEVITWQPLWWLLLLIVLALGLALSLVDQPFWKRLLSLVFRAAGVVLLVIMLCRPFAAQASRGAHLVFLVDVSQSVDLAASRKAVEKIQAGIGELSPEDSWSLYAVSNGLKRFYSTGDLEKYIGQLQGDQFDDKFRSQTRLAEGLLASRFDFPAEKAKRISIYSDGQGTTESLDATLQQLKDESIDVRFSRLATLQTPEVAVLELAASTPRAYIGEVVRMSVQVTANRAMKAQLRLVHRGVAIQQLPVELKTGKPNRFSFDVDMLTPGDSRWTVEVVPDEDHFTINNQRTCTVTVQGKPRVLIVHRDPQEVRTIARALEGQNLVVEARGEFGLPNSMEAMLAFDAIVLADIPATSMSPRQMSLLSRYVQDFGGGLAMLGSENSFGLGGYHNTPVEEVLPLVSRFEKEKEKPSLAMVLVIDKSGSMEGMPMALARQAAKSAADLLGARDQIAVVGFDGSPLVVCEMRSATEKSQIQGSIDSLAAGGGTDMYPAMVIARDMLESTNAKIRHMICLGDGQTPGADFQSLVQRLTDGGITVSTVALGQADRGLMASIAEQGKGRFYETNDPANVPQIFTRETMQASQSAIKEDLYGSVQNGDHPVLSGFQDADLPFTLGFVMTQPKPTSQLLLVTETGDPLLAVSRFGLGQGLAFTCDLSEKWGGDWLAWDSCGKFWGQVFRGITRKNDTAGMSVQSRVNDGHWDLEIQRRDTTGAPVSQVAWDIGVVRENGTTESFQATEAGLGRYQVQVPLEQERSMTLRVRDIAADKLAVLHFDPPYPAEYQLGNDLPESLAGLPPLPEAGPGVGLIPKRVRQSVSVYFGLAALGCFLIGNLLRRV